MKKNAFLITAGWIFVCMTSMGLLAQDRIIIPHIPQNTATFDIDLVIENLLNQQRYLLIEGIGNAGNGLGVETVDVAPQERLLLDPRNIFKEEPPAWLIISGRGIGEQPVSQDTMTGLVAGVSYQLAGNPDSATFVEGVRKPARNWRIHTGNWQETFDGLAMVNTDRCAGTSVRLYHHRSDGSLIEMVDVSPTRGGLHKVVVNLGTVLRAEPGSYVNVSADVSLAITGLRGSLDLDAKTSYLIGNVAVPIPNFEKERRILEENRDKWRAAGVSGSYIFNQHFLCFCEQDFGRDVALKVTDGWVESYAYADQNGEVPVANRTNYRTVEGLFDLIEEAFNQEYYGVNVVYDEQYGYPLEIDLDHDACTVDEEISFRSSDLRPIK